MEPIKTKTDGRNFRHARTTNPTKLELNDNYLFALQFIHRHTYAATNILFEAMRPRLASKRYDQFVKRGQIIGFVPKLFDGGYIYRPEAQRNTEYPDSHFDVYALTEKGVRALKTHGLYEEVVKHSGSFPHQLMGATFTATIDILCDRAGYRFIPAHEFIKGGSMKLEIPFMWEDKPINGKYATFIPDYVYAIDFGDSTIAFLPEFNRDTEPRIPRSYKRRSDLLTIRQLKQLIGRGDYKTLFDCKYPMFYQFITVTEDHAMKFLSLAEKEMGNSRDILANVMPTFKTPFKPPYFPEFLFTDPWLTNRKGGFTIKKTAS